MSKWERVWADGDTRTALGGGAYGFTQTAMANLREKDDAWNSATAGFFAGSILGLTSTDTCPRRLTLHLDYGNHTYAAPQPRECPSCSASAPASPPGRESSPSPEDASGSTGPTDQTRRSLTARWPCARLGDARSRRRLQRLARAEVRNPTPRPSAQRLTRYRNPPTRLRGAQTRKAQGEVRSRDQPRQGDSRVKKKKTYPTITTTTTKPPNPPKRGMLFFSSPFVHTQARERKTVGTRRGVSSARGMETVLFVPMLSLSFSLRVASPRDVCLSLTTHPPHRVITNGTLLTALLLPLRRMMIL